MVISLVSFLFLNPTGPLIRIKIPLAVSSAILQILIHFNKYVFQNSKILPPKKDSPAQLG